MPHPIGAGARVLASSTARKNRKNKRGGIVAEFGAVAPPTELKRAVADHALPGTQWQRPVWHFAVAGCSGDLVASLFTQPFDLTKVRMQLRGELSRDVHPSGLRAILGSMRSIAAKEGVWGRGPGLGLYSGISASLTRQLLWSTTRFGMFAWLLHNIGGYQTSEFAHAGLAEKMAYGVMAGAIGACIGNPGDCALIRMQADGHWPAHQRRGYRNILDGWRQIVTREGPATLWRGTEATLLRAVLITSTQLPAYITAKSVLTSDEYVGARKVVGMPALDPTESSTHVICGVTAGLAAAVITNPIDVVKTRTMNMQNVPGAARYGGLLSSLVTIVRAEGPAGLVKGLVPCAMRLVPHNIVLWLVQERVLAALVGRTM